MNNRRSEHDDIRPEYDFSQGIRGRHAALSVSRDEPAPSWMCDAIRYDKQAWISEALRRSQELEGLLVVYLALAFHLEPTDAGRDVSHLLEDPEDQELRRISADLEASGLSPASDLQPGLGRFFNERHWLIHRSLQHQDDDANTREAGKFTERLQKLSSEAAAMTEKLRQLILARCMRAGMTEVEFEKKAESVIQQWLAA